MMHDVGGGSGGHTYTMLQPNNSPAPPTTGKQLSRKRNFAFNDFEIFMKVTFTQPTICHSVVVTVVTQVEDAHLDLKFHLANEMREKWHNRNTIKSPGHFVRSCEMGERIIF